MIKKIRDRKKYTKPNDHLDISLNSISKEYSKYNNDLKRLLSVLIPCTKMEKFIALKNINLQIKQGEKVAFLGKNGAGKSTLLKLISGITLPTTGNINVNRRVSLLLEVSAGFNIEFTAKENILIRGILLGLTKKEILSKQEEIFEFAEIDIDFQNQLLKRFSSGMIAKLGFAINLICNPEILIVDEALAVGDVGFKLKCEKEIKKLSKEEKLTLIFVSHDQKMVEEFCDRGIYISNSEIKADGPIKEVFKIYNNDIKKENK